MIASLQAKVKCSDTLHHVSKLFFDTRIVEHQAKIRLELNKEFPDQGFKSIFSKLVSDRRNQDKRLHD